MEKPFPSSFIPQQHLEHTSGRGSSASPAPVKFSIAGPPRGKGSSESEPQHPLFPENPIWKGWGFPAGTKANKPC